MRAETFVTLLCNVLDLPKRQIGIEAFRWAILSLNPEISSRAFTIYRMLRVPITAAFVDSLLLSLLGSLETYYNQRVYVRNLLPPREIMDILDVCASINRERFSPAIFWTGVAFLMSNVPALYLKSLEFLIESNLDVISKIPLFWDFSSDWAPRFSGMQKFILAGLFNAKTESLCVKLFMRLLKCNSKALLNPEPTRDIVTIVSICIFVLGTLSSNPNTAALVQLQELIDVVTSTIDASNPHVVNIKVHLTELGESLTQGKPTDREDFINRLSVLIISAYFPKFSSDIARALTLIIRNSDEKFHFDALQIGKKLLNRGGRASRVLESMEQFVLLSSEIVLKKKAKKNIVLLAADIITGVLELLQERTIVPAMARRLTATAESGDSHRAETSDSIMISSSFIEVVPSERSLFYSMNVLRRIVQVCAKFPNREIFK